jgi:hypothetical protein
VLASLNLAQRQRAGLKCLFSARCGTSELLRWTGQLSEWRRDLVEGGKKKRPACAHCAARDHAHCVGDGVVGSWAMESPSCESRQLDSDVVHRDLSSQRVCAGEPAMFRHVLQLVVHASAKGPPKRFWRPNLCADRNRFGRQVRSPSFSC